MSKSHVFPDRIYEKTISVTETIRISLTRHTKIRYPYSTRMIQPWHKCCTSSPTGGTIIIHADINSKQEKKKKRFF